MLGRRPTLTGRWQGSAVGTLPRTKKSSRQSGGGVAWVNPEGRLPHFPDGALCSSSLHPVCFRPTGEIQNLHRRSLGNQSVR